MKETGLKPSASYPAAEVLAMARTWPRERLWELAHEVTLAYTPKVFDFCAIVSARQGKCSENCKWCAQSAHYRTGCETYGWVGTEKCVAAARAAEANGASRIGIVTSGRGQTDRQIEEICAAVAAMRKEARPHVCASLGLVTREQLKKLKAAGLERIHCNIETSPRRFGELCTTHTFAEKLATLEAAKELGFQICSGGIIGMGETDEDLVAFAETLKAIAPDSIPVNILHPIKGTPLGESARLGIDRILTAIAILRLVNPYTPLRFAGGRRDLTDDEARRCIYVGMSAGIAGPLLTTPGADYDDDRALAREAGYDTRPDWD